MKKVYMAGKIDHTDWRHTIFKGLRNGDRGPVEDFLYNGPFFVSCDHGCFHGESNHGRGVSTYGCGTGTFTKDDSEVEGKTPGNVVVKDCTNDIKSSDIVFVWIDSPDAYGTIAEIGIAHAFKKPIFIGISKSLTLQQVDDMWFSLHMAKKVVNCKTAMEAWREFVDFFNS